MMPWIISHELMRANEAETVRATRYAHHRAHTYRRPGPVLALLLEEWMSKIPIPRHLRTASRDQIPEARDTLCLSVSDLGSVDTTRAADASAERRT
jgi:hypothetical protein